jgi:cytoskeletal protein RodZ
MNRFLIILIIVVSLAGVAAGVLFLLRPNTPAPAPTTTQDNTSPTNNSTVSVSVSSTDPQAVQAAYRAELAKHPSDNTKLSQTVIADGYALQVFSGDILGGEALLKYDTVQGSWVLLDGGGGAWTVGSLVAQGVPTSTAQTLWAQVPH